METYTKKNGKYGLHKCGDIVKIIAYSYTIKRQELHFKINKGTAWGYVDDFIAFSNSKRKLRRIKNENKGVRK